MSPFVKTCITEIALIAALAAPVVIAGCEPPTDPPVAPRAATDTGPGAAAPDPAPIPQGAAT